MKPRPSHWPSPRGLCSPFKFSHHVCSCMCASPARLRQTDRHTDNSTGYWTRPQLPEVDQKKTASHTHTHTHTHKSSHLTVGGREMARCSAAVGLPLVWVILVTAVVTRGGPSTGILERMDQCDTRCSQGLQCKTKRHFLSPPPCQSSSPEALNSSAVFHSVRLSTVMLCEDIHACSLHLRVNVLLHLTEPVHGVSICVESAGTLGHCQALGFSRASRQRQAGQQVELEADCFEVRPGQQVWVTLKTVPNYCTVSWTSTYTVPDCNSGDLRSHVPECITGRLQYQLHPDGKQMSVSVSDMLEHKDYNVRLCHQDYVCADTGAYALIRKEEVVKRVTLMYSRPVPCLCIEGWSAVMDAPRVQLCPFKDRLEELWYGITFDLVEETLSWEPACPVSASVRLCQSGREESCVDLPHSHPTKTTGRKKITFTTVDPHPQLCMKFTVGSQNWTRCPFAEGRFQAWEAGVREREGHGGVTLLSQVTANFSVGVCTRLRGSPSVCQPDDVRTVHVEQREPVSVLLSEDFCKPNTCVQVKRLDVKYAVTLLHCDLQCADHNGSVESVPVGGEWDRRGSPPAQLSWVLVLAGVSLAVLTIVALGLYLMLTVYQRENPKEMAGKHTSEKHKEVHVEPTDCMIPEVQTHTAPPPTHMSMSDTFCCGNFEKTNLLSETSKQTNVTQIPIDQDVNGPRSYTVYL